MDSSDSGYVHTRSKAADALIRATVYARCNGLCAICGEYVAFDVMHLDHIKPLRWGGEDVESNLQAAHAHCNYAKGAEFEGKRPPQRKRQSSSPQRHGKVTPGLGTWFMPDPSEPSPYWTKERNSDSKSIYWRYLWTETGYSKEYFYSTESYDDAVENAKQRNQKIAILEEQHCRVKSDWEIQEQSRVLRELYRVIRENGAMRLAERESVRRQVINLLYHRIQELNITTEVSG